MRDLLAVIGGLGRIGGISRTKKRRQIILLATIFALGAGLFFSNVFRSPDALASNSYGVARSRNIQAKNIKEELDPLARLKAGKNGGDSEDGLQKECEIMLEGYPIEGMLSEINKLDSKTAAFLVAIAKKESNWGKRSPSKNGRDCFNYWGYKGGGEDQVLGYSCFSSREEAVEKVGARIENLIQKGLDTPEEMLVWKCGSSCVGHNPQDVRKWVADVKLYFNKLNS